MSRESDARSMKNLKILSPFRDLLDHPLLLVILAWLILSAKSCRAAVYVLALLLAGMMAGWKQIVSAALILGIFLIPFHQTEPFYEGRVIQVRNSYCIVKNGHGKMLVYTRQRPILDSWISWNGTIQDLSEARGFWRFDFAAYCHRQGIYQAVSADSITVLHPSRSLRGYLMKRIQDRVREEDREVLLNLLFQIRSPDQFEGIFADRGFSLSGVIAFLTMLFSFFLYEEDNRRVTFIITLLLAAVFHFPYLLVQRLIFSTLGFLGCSGRKKTGIGYLIGLRLFPSAAGSAAFLIPAVYRFSKSRSNSHLNRLWISCQMESLLFHTVNPLELLSFRLLLPCMGFLWLLGMMEALFLIPAASWIKAADRLLAFVQIPERNGTMLGLGLLFYLLLLATFRKHSRRNEIRILLFLLFQYGGLFHPLPELTFINVGQGDAILIKGPYGKGTVLVDTGKPSQWNALNGFLKAKGIQRLDAMIITHSDKDHSGNMERVEDTYHSEKIITDHEGQYILGGMLFHDLNTIESEDENESSVITCFRMNGLNILLMGDASFHTEESLLKKYDMLSADILKLSHHGSATGNSAVFLDTVRPELAIVSSGAYRIYHHPSPEVTNRLNQRRIPYLDTKEEGDITILCLPAGQNLLVTSSGTIGWIRSKKEAEGASLKGVRKFFSS